MIESHIVELTGRKQLNIRTEMLDGDRLGPNELLGRTICSVISPGTEGAAYRGDPPLRPMKVYPRVVGYCNTAEVLACGDGVKQFSPGDRVLTTQSHRSTFICMADNVLARVPADMDPIAATTTYLFQLGYNALLKGNVTPGNRLAIVGLGTLGLATAALGAVLEARIHAFSNQVFSRDVLEKFHISTIFRKSDAGGQYNIEQVTGGHGIDVVVSTSNTWDDWRLTLSLPRREGTICVLGFPGRGAGPPLFNPLSSEFFYDRQLKIVACGMTPNSDGSPGSGAHTLLQNCKFILGLIASGRLPARTLISAVVPWREVGSIYERIVAPEPAFLTAALTWT